MKSLYKKYSKEFNLLFVILGIFFIIASWELISYLVDEPYVFPSFSYTFVRLFALLRLSKTYEALFFSLGISLLAILVSTILAIILGTIAGLSKPFKSFLSPLISIFKTVPTVLVVIILIIFFKNILSYLIIVFLIVFPIIYEACAKGIESIDINIYDSLRLEGLYRPKSIFKVILPMSESYINSGLASAIGIGIKVEIMAEILVGSDLNYGIGSLIYEIKAITFEYRDLYAYTIIILLMFLVIDLLLYIFKKVFFKNFLPSKRD